MPVSANTTPDIAPQAPAERLAVAAARPDDGADDILDLRALLLPLWRRKGIVLLTVALAVVAGLAVALGMDNRYTASARVIFEPERLRIIDIESVVAAPSDDPNILLQNQIEILRSAVLLERVIETLMLEATPEFNPGAAGGRFENALERLPWPPVVARQLAKLGLLPPAGEAALTPDERAARLRAAVLAQLIEAMRLRPVPNSFVIEIAYESTNPALAAAIVNATAEQYIVVQTERKRDDIAQATEILGTRVRDLENRLNTAEEAVRLAQVDLAMGGEYGSTIIARQIEALHDTLGQAREARRIIEERLAAARAALESEQDLHANADFRASPIIVGLQVRAAELRNEAAAITSVVANAANPGLRRIEARLAEVERNIGEEAERLIAGLATELRSALAREAVLGDELAALEARALEQSRAEMRLGQLQREADARREIYESFLTRMNETSEQAALQAPDARFLTRATTPSAPDNTLRFLVLALSALAGTGLGVGIVLVLERLNDTFRSMGDVERRTGLPVVAGIPRTGRRQAPRQLLTMLLDRPAGALAESTRNLRTSILFSNLDQAPKVVMFASSLPMEGKTTTAMLTAITSQQMERSAVIVDCDLRRRTMGSIFPIAPDQPGLFAALQGTASIEEAVYVEPETGVHVLAPEPAAQGLGNAADILASRRFQRLIAQLRVRYDLVILDTPPVLAVADPRIVAQHADALVYLVRWNRTRQGAVLEGLRELRSVNARIAGVALTLVDERQAARHFAGEYLYKPSYGS